MKSLIQNCFFVLVIVNVFTFSGCHHSQKNQTSTQGKNSSLSFDPSKELVYYNEVHLQLVKKKIKAKDPYFFERYQEVMKAGKAALDYEADPVTNKTRIPPSYDKHDYLSFAPYRWPDSKKSDGLPWIARDGIINPVSRGEDTDYLRRGKFFKTIGELTWAYYFSDDKIYAEKAIELIKIWYLNPETKVNPNINFGQGVPGIADGRQAGVLEWREQSEVITALQIFEANKILPADVKNGMDEWLREYLNWLITDTMAISAGFTRQNHSNHYNYQVVGLMMYFGKNAEAKAIVDDAKLSRIADQIMPDGAQPREMGRTKSVSYTTSNLWSMTELILMGKKLGIDLWTYETEDGRSIKKAYQYLVPFVLGTENWPKQQITKGGAEEVIENGLKPLFSKASTALGTSLIDPDVECYRKLSDIDVLKYPPVEMLPEILHLHDSGAK